MACAATRVHGDFLAYADSKGHVWVSVLASVSVCVDVHDEITSKGHVNVPDLGFYPRPC